MIVLYFLVAFLLSYLFLRKINISREGSVLGSMAFTFSQFNIHWAGNIAVTASIILLPAVFLAVQNAFDNQKQKKYLFTLSIILALSWSSAHSQLVVFSLLSGFFYALYMIRREFLSGKMASDIMRQSSPLLFSVLAGTIMAFPQLFYSWRFSQLSTRMGGLSYALAATDPATFLDWIKYFLPGFGLRYGISPEFLPYIGIFPLIFALVLAVRIFKKRVPADGQLLFFVGLFLFSVLISIKYSPLFWISQKIPIINYFRSPTRWMFIGNFAATVLAGAGFDYAIANLSQWQAKVRMWLKRFLLVFSGAALLSNGVHFFWGSSLIELSKKLFDEHWYSRTTGLSLEYYHNVLALIIENSFKNLSFANYKFYLPAAMIVLCYGAIKYFGRDCRKFTTTVLLLTLINSVVVGVLELKFADASLITKPPEIADVIRGREKNSTEYRVFSLFIGMASSQKITALQRGQGADDGLRFILDGLAANSNVFWNIPHVDGYEPMASSRNRRMLSIIGSESDLGPYSSMANESISLDQKLQAFLNQLPVLSMTNTKYIISAYELPVNNDFVLIHTAFSTRFHVPIYVYENKSVLSRIYFTNNVSFVVGTNEEENFELILGSGNNFSKNTFIECADCQQYRNQPSKTDTINILTYKDGYVELSVTTERGRWLVFSESNLPGWRVAMDGQAVQSYMANYLFHSIYVPPGVHSVVFEYTGLLTIDNLEQMIRQLFNFPLFY